MPTLDDARRIALALPEVVEAAKGHHRWAGWSVRGKSVAWERPLLSSDVARLEGAGERVPSGEIIAVRVAGVEAKPEALAVPGTFDIEHFAGYPAVLVQLDEVSLEDLEDLIAEAWRLQAPQRLLKEHGS